MNKLLLSLHVLAALVTVGPVTVAASMFPAALRRAPGDQDALTTLRTLHRVCRVYAGIGVAVPLFGLATAGGLGVLGDAWLIVSILLTAAAAGVLGLLILPAQERALAGTEGDVPPDRLLWEPGRFAMVTGVFNLLWAAVTVLMIIRPGSTTGV
ncbi:DUF2269 family protein [Streptomyces andamanensis]|uniref:DUF2269 family protein n=1 Tax=Streptomyces andamanensis TaxID=1565035 RepID=A0ABV8TRW7_9ACTN|nr:DUF2269 family protein [Streptomyces sp. PsTaAH-124]